MLRLLWGFLFLLALAIAPLVTLTMLALLIVLFRPFHRRKYGRPSVTLREEVVRSAAEKFIADWFYQNGIRYVYEKPAFDRKGSTISRPDFYLPDYRVYVEYWGLAGTGKEYDGMMKWKTEQYRRNGIRVVSFFPNDLKHLGDVFNHRLVDALEMSTAQILP